MDMKQQKTISLQVEELEERVAPTIVLTNPGGNEPQGMAPPTARRMTI
jgi:hypothetical protein